MLEETKEINPVERAKEYCRGMIADLLQNKIDLSELVITKGLGKRAEEEKKGQSSNNTYVSKAAHTELATKMRKRDEASAPNVGDRVAYVMVDRTKNSKGYEKAEDPLYALQNNLPIDTKYYLDNQLKKPLVRIFEPILGERAE